MAGSLRRKAKHKVVVKKRKPKHGLVRAKLPDDVQDQLVLKKLGVQPSWNVTQTLDNNYTENRLVNDPNAGFGRNKAPDPMESLLEEDPTIIEREADDDVKAGCNEERSSGKAPPKRLTPNQRDIIARLVAVHGDDVKAMVTDRKVNKMQHSEGALRKMIVSMQHWSRDAGVDFRIKVKSL